MKTREEYYNMLVEDDMWIRDIPKELLADRSFVMSVLEEKQRNGVYGGAILAHLPETFKDDYDIVREAVKGHGIQLNDASARLRDDDVICCLAVDDYPFAYEFISDRLKSNKSILLAALRKVDKNDAEIILSYAPECLRSDDDIQSLVKNLK